MFRYVTHGMIAAALCICAASAQEPSAYGVVYVTDGTPNGLRATEKQVGKVTKGPAANSVEIAGARSPVRIAATAKPQFLLKLEPGNTPGSWNLFRFAVESGTRKLAFVPNSREIKITAGQQLDFRAERTGGVYRLIPLAPLGPGEYGFSPSGSSDTFLFGVDAPARK